MKRNKSRGLAILAGLSAGIMLVGCASGGESDDAAVPDDCTPVHEGLSTLTEGELAVGISDMPPLVMTEGEGGFDGLDADIIKGFAEAECLVIEPVNVGATAAVTSVEQGRVDTSLGGWSRTEERDQILSLSGPMYLDGIIVVGDQEYSTFDELDGLNIGVVQGYVVQGELEAAFPGQVQSYPEATLLSEDLKTGRIDVAVDVSSSVAYYDEGLVVNVLEPDERLQTTVNPIQTALPFNKENPDLADAFSAYLEVIHESGEIVELLEKWGIDPSMADVGEPRFV